MNDDTAYLSAARLTMAHYSVTFHPGSSYVSPTDKKKTKKTSQLQLSKNRWLQSREADVEESFCYSRQSSPSLSHKSSGFQFPILHCKSHINQRGHVRPQPPSVRRSTRQPIFWIQPDFWKISWCGKLRGFACLERAHTNVRILYGTIKLWLKREKVSACVSLAWSVVCILLTAALPARLHRHALTNRLRCSIFCPGRERQLPPRNIPQ